MSARTRMVWKDISITNLCYYLVIISMYLFSIQKISKVKKKSKDFKTQQLQQLTTSSFAKKKTKKTH